MTKSETDFLSWVDKLNEHFLGELYESADPIQCAYCGDMVSPAKFCHCGKNPHGPSLAEITLKEHRKFFEEITLQRKEIAEFILANRKEK